MKNALLFELFTLIAKVHFALAAFKTFFFSFSEVWLWCVLMWISLGILFEFSLIFESLGIYNLTNVGTSSYYFFEFFFSPVICVLSWDANEWMLEFLNSPADLLSFAATADLSYLSLLRDHTVANTAHLSSWSHHATMHIWIWSHCTLLYLANLMSLHPVLLWTFVLLPLPHS